MTAEELILIHSDELYHHGIKGQKWGVRRTLEQLGYKIGISSPEKKAAKEQAKRISEEAKRKAKIFAKQRKAQAIVDKAREKAEAKLKKAKGEKFVKEKMNKEREDLIKKSERDAVSKKSVKDMTDDEIRSRINRIKLENELKTLSNTNKKKGDGFIKTVAKQVVTPALIAAGKQSLEKYAKDTFDTALGNNKKSSLQKLAEQADLEKRIYTAKSARNAAETSSYRTATDRIDFIKKYGVNYTRLIASK